LKKKLFLKKFLKIFLTLYHKKKQETKSKFCAFSIFMILFFIMEARNKKILFIITKANWGGAQKYVFDLANEIAERDNYEVVVAYGKPFGELSEKLKTARIRTIEIDGLGRDINFFGEFGVAKKLWKILKEEKPDVIHLNSPKIGGLGGLLGRLIGIKKIIYTSHGWTFNEDLLLWQTFLIKYFSWLTIIFSHKTIVIAKKEYDQVVGWPFVSAKKLELIYNGIKPICFLNRDEAQEYFGSCLADKQAKISNEDLVVGTIAELHKNKGLKYAIEGFEEITENNQQVKLIMIGEGEERQKLEKEIEEEKLSDKVFLVGKIEEASRYLKAFDIFLLSSIKEGFPFVLLEAGLAKLPVIASDVGGISELIEGGKNGILVKAGESSEVTLALETLIKNKELRENYGQALYKKVKNDFSFDGMVEKTERLY